MVEKVIVRETNNKVVVSTPGPQGPRGRTILSGVGAPAENFGLQGDFYLNISNSNFIGPKLNDTSWVGANLIDIATTADLGKTHSWELAQVTGPVDGVYSLVINHNLGFYPNVTVRTSAGDMLETGIYYNNSNTITLTMAQPFSGTAYLS